MAVRLGLWILRSGRVRIGHNFANEIDLLCGGKSSIYKGLNQRILPYFRFDFYGYSNYY